jgi:hypothetical protein
MQNQTPYRAPPKEKQLPIDKVSIFNDGIHFTVVLATASRMSRCVHHFASLTMER